MRPALPVPISVSPQKNYYWRIAGFYFFYFAYVGAYSPYWSLYLESIRFDAADIAFLVSVQPVMRMLAPALWGWLADHWGNRLLVVQLAALSSALCYLGVFFTTKFWTLLLVMAAMSFFWSATIPLVEAATLSYLGANTSRYGRIRAWGSLGFIVTVLGLGYAFDYLPIRWLLWVGLFILLGIVVFSRQIPATPTAPHHTDSVPLRRIFLQPQVLALFGACFLMAVAHGPYYTFFSIYLVEHGYAKSAVGLLWALGVMCEIGAFFLMPWLMRRYTLPQILAASLGVAVVRFLLIAWGVDSLGVMLAAQVLHAITFGTFHATGIALVHHFFVGRHQARGQALYGSLTYGAGGMLGGIASGQVWEHWGAAATYSMSAMMALLGLGILLWKLRRVHELKV